MRIGLITPGFSASEQDWCIPALLDLVRVLAERDDVTVFTLRYPHRRREYQVHGATVFPTGGAQRGGLARVPILLRTLARIRREARRRPFDVWHALWAHEPGFLAAEAGRLTGAPVMVSILGGELEDLPNLDYGGGRSRVNRWLIARALAAADRVTVGSRSLLPAAEQRVGPEKLHLQPLGVDFERFAPGPPAGVPTLAGNPRLLNVASLSPIKDHETLLSAFAVIARKFPQARLHLVGEGALERDVRARARRHAVDERLELHGAVGHGRLADYYRQADVFVQSSRFESQGMVVLEAAACGCPVAGTAVGIVSEICAAERTATPGDGAALAAAIEATLVDPPTPAQMTEAVEGFELRSTVERTRKSLAELAARGRETVARETVARGNKVR